LILTLIRLPQIMLLLLICVVLASGQLDRIMASDATPQAKEAAARCAGRTTLDQRGPHSTIEGEEVSGGGADRIKRAAKAPLEARAAEENASPLEPYRSLGDASMPSAAIDPAVTTFLSKLCDGAGSFPDSIAALIFPLAARVTRLEQTTSA